LRSRAAVIGRRLSNREVRFDAHSEEVVLGHRTTHGDEAIARIISAIGAQMRDILHRLELATAVRA
jgi:hypothetical protein